MNNFFFISHRGNLNGAISSEENKPSYIEAALKSGVDVEIDVWFIDNKFFLGHDIPEYEIETDFILQDNLWLHAKNVIAFKKILDLKIKNGFFHNQDEVALTTSGFLWNRPETIITEKSICLLPEIQNIDINQLKDSAGICSDNILKYKNIWD